MSLETIQQKVNGIQMALNLKVNREDGDEVVEHLQNLVLTQSDCAEAQALSSMVLATKVGELYASPAYTGMNATDKRAVVNGKCSKELYYVELTSRLSSSMSHAIEAYRSILSDLKEQRRQFMQNGGV